MGPVCTEHEPEALVALYCAPAPFASKSPNRARAALKPTLMNKAVQTEGIQAVSLIHQSIKRQLIADIVTIGL